MSNLKKIILLSGPIGSGKTTLQEKLEFVFGCNTFKTSEALKKKLNLKNPTRLDLQREGESLDNATNGKWVLESLNEYLMSNQGNKFVIVDSIRIKEQIDIIRRNYEHLVFHFHLSAPKPILKERFEKLKSKNQRYESGTFKETQRNKTEKNISKLEKYADVLIDTKRCTKEDVLVKAASHLGFYGREHQRLVDVLIGGQYGSEGKGNIVSYLAKDYDYLVRVGGPNAGHKVYKEDNIITFHQLPSGTAHSNANLIIGPGTVIDPEVLLKEIKFNKIDKSRLAIDPNAMIISDDDKKNEVNLKKDIASTASGAGYALARKITLRGKEIQLAKDIKEIKPFIKESRAVFDNAFMEGKKVLLEGTQGTGLSIHHGPYPYVTSRDTTVAGCLSEAGISPNRVRKVIMVCRTYPIRVQNPDDLNKTSGKISQEITYEELSKRSGIPIKKLKKTETTSTTKRQRRIGEFEWDLLRKSTSLNAPTDIALTFADYINKDNQKARRFDQLTEETIKFIEEVERVALAPVSLISTRFHYRSIIDRRSWR